MPKGSLPLKNLETAQIRELATTGHAKRQSCRAEIAEFCGVANSHLWPGMANSRQWRVQCGASSHQRLVNRPRPPTPARLVAGDPNLRPNNAPRSRVRFRQSCRLRSTHPQSLSRAHASTRRIPKVAFRGPLGTWWLTDQRSPLNQKSGLSPSD